MRDEKRKEEKGSVRGRYRRKGRRKSVRGCGSERNEKEIKIKTKKKRKRKYFSIGRENCDLSLSFELNRFGDMADAR